MQRNSNCFTNAVSSTVAMLKAVAVPATNSAVAAVAHTGVQIARQLDASPTKDAIKHYFALGASAANAGGVAVSYLDLMNTLFVSGAWNLLTGRQRGGIAVLGVVAMAGTAYASNVFGVEEHILWAAVSSVGSETALIAANSLATFFANRNRQNLDTAEDMENLITAQAYMAHH